MTDQELDAIIAAKMQAEEAEPLRWWWLTFFDEGTREFRGAACVRARGVFTGARRAAELNINPPSGAWSAFNRLPEVWGDPPEEVRERLVSVEADAERIIVAFRGAAS